MPEKLQQEPPIVRGTAIQPDAARLAPASGEDAADDSVVRTTENENLAEREVVRQDNCQLLAEDVSEPAVVAPQVPSKPAANEHAAEMKAADLEAQDNGVGTANVAEQYDVAQHAVIAQQPVIARPQFVSELPSPASARRFRWYHAPFWLLGRGWDVVSLSVLLAVVSAIPIVQFASLGYLLQAAANLAQRRPWSSAFPGLRLAGKMGTFAMLAALCWLPVLFVTDLSYSAQLLQPGTGIAVAWRIAAFAITFAWVAHVTWAAMRGGRWWHFLWPAPLRWTKHIWRPGTWSKASDDLYSLVTALQFPHLWWLGARAAVGVLLWTSVPVSLMIIGQRADDLQPAALVGLVGAAAMILIMLYLPFLQIQLAMENRFTAIFQLRAVRRRFLYAPIAHAISLLLLCLFCIPLYLLRIEATPAELLWAPSLVFVIFMLPAKLMLGAAMGYADGRRRAKQLPMRHWTLRWPSRVVALASVLIYVGALYVAQLVAGQGAFVMYFQHAFLFPAPLISS